MKSHHAVIGFHLLLAIGFIQAQSQTISIPLRAGDNGGHFDTLWFGQDAAASYCVDAAFGESTLPPRPPSGIFDVRWVESRTGSTCLDQGLKRDFRPGDDTYRFVIQPGYGGYPLTLNWGDLGSLTAKTITLTDLVTGGTLVNVDMKSQSSLVVTQTYLQSFLVILGSPPPTDPLTPSAQTGAAYDYSQTSAELSSSVNPNGLATMCWFEWGPTDAYGQTTAAQSVGAGSQFTGFSQSISGLQPQTGYHFRVAAQNSVGTTYGADQTLITIPNGTIGERLLPLTITDHGGRSKTLWLGVHESATYCIDATLGELDLPPSPPFGTFDARLILTEQFSGCFQTGTITDFREYIGPDHGDLYKIVFQPGGSGDPVTLSWPDPGAWYAGSIFLRDVIDGSVVNIDMKSRTSYTVGDPSLKSFSIVSGDPLPESPNAPIATTHQARFTTQSASVLTGSVNPAGDPTNVWFEWGHTEAYGNTTTPQSIGDGSSSVSVTAEISGLYPRMDHHFRLVAQNSIGTTYGNDQIFMTIPEGIRGVTLFQLDVSDGDLDHELLWLGVVPDATACIDDYLGEVELPPRPPFGVFNARAVGLDGSSCLGQGLVADFREQVDDTQIDTFALAFQPGSSGYPMNFTWDDLSAYFSGPVRLTDPFGGLVVSVEMTAQTGYSLTDNRISSLLLVTGPAASVSALPAVMTGSALAVSQGAATLTGDLRPNGLETTVWFEYGTTSAYGSATTSQSAGNGSGIVSVTQSAAGLMAGTTYHYRIVAENGSGHRYGPDMVFATDAVTGVDEPEPIPDRYSLSQNYPNPFNPSTVIEYDLPAEGHVKIEIVDVLGQTVRTLVDRVQGPGKKSVVFDAAGLPGGVYYCRMISGTFVQVGKLALLR